MTSLFCWTSVAESACELAGPALTDKVHLVRIAGRPTAFMYDPIVLCHMPINHAIFVPHCALLTSMLMTHSMSPLHALLIARRESNSQYDDQALVSSLLAIPVQSALCC